MPIHTQEEVSQELDKASSHHIGAIVEPNLIKCKVSSSIVERPTKINENKNDSQLPIKLILEYIF